MALKKILLLWYQEGSNFGDVLIAQTVRNYLTEKGICVVDCEVGKPCMEIFTLANECDFLLFAGGGIIERYVPNVIRHFAEDYEFLNVPYGIIGLGVAEYNYSNYYDAIAFWVNNSAFFYVRDNNSKMLLDRISHSKRIICSADNVFVNKRIAREKIKKHGTDGKIGINLRQMPYSDITGELSYNIIGKTCKECEINVYIPDDEIYFGDDYLDGLRKNNANNAGLRKKKDKTTWIINAILQCEIVVAMRFHVILVAARLDVLPIPIIYSSKVRALAEQLGIIELALDFTETDKIPEKLKQATENKEYYLSCIRQNVKILEEKATTMFQEITDYMEKEML